MSVVSVKVSPRIKEKMQEHSSSINWADEIRKFLAQRVEELERSKAIDEAIELQRSLPAVPKGTTRSLMREDRDSH